MKLIIWLVILFAGWHLARRWIRRKLQQQIEALKAQQAQAAGGSAPAPVVDTVVCAQCGVHLARPEALMIGNQAYCCREHADAGPAHTA
ncbi:PP0621 family protein [Amphibiibacter pelophylacis]|uniref:PP0621 family protein n=1 Tax=Amphibiibacter pelophylacis TaxID=1799477 RepID=A0ACC6P219_9BURK